MYKVLVIVDEQVDFTTGVLGNPECIATIPKIVNLIQTDNYQDVILTQDTHNGNYLNTQEGKKLPIPHCIANTKGWQIVPEIMDAVHTKFTNPHIYQVHKKAFGSPNIKLIFDQIMKNNNVSETELEIHFVGVCTGICVISNVLITKASLPETKVCVIKNACACVTHQSHETAIAAMANCQVDII